MIHLPRKPRCYNSGKISGMRYLTAMAKFRAVDNQIEKKLKMSPVNPMLYGLQANRPYIMHLIYDIYLLFRCDAIYMQDDWENSYGARLEHRVARLFRFKIYYSDDKTSK
jgi:hypothetical protein